ncbi:MAG TPA: hypothetical protein VH637_00455 [Streptosporangiaceae bacterium]
MTALAVAGCGASAVQTSAAGPAGPVQATSSAPVPAPPAPQVKKSKPARSHSPAAPKPAAASQQLPQHGNLNGHVPVPRAGQAVSTAHPDHVIGHGTPGSCTSAAVVKAVAEGGVITFNCGPKPVTITMKASANIVHGSRIVIDGGGKVTLSGGGRIRILVMFNCTHCWEQASPHLIVQNMRFVDGYSGVHQSGSSPNYGGGAIFDQGGQLTVVNSAFVGNRCYQYGPDLGGGAIRAVGMDMSTPVYLTGDTFRDNQCSNGGAVSGLYANFILINSLLMDNKAIGWGANPAASGTPGGGSGGGVYTDGNGYKLIIEGTAIHDNSAREGGGGIFCVVNNSVGGLTIEHSVLQRNTSGQFQNAPGIFDSRGGHDVQPTLIDSTVN